MNKIALLSACLACVGHSRRVQSQSAWSPAFTPTSQPATPQQRAVSQASVSAQPAVNMAASATGLSWYQPGVGEMWDPLGLGKDEEKFRRLRYVEVKHGRIAMLAVLGHMVTAAGVRWPGELYNHVKFSSITGSGYKALSQLSPQDYAVILAFVGYLELRVMKEEVKGEFPGDLRNGLFKEGWDGFSESEKVSKINKELNNGRAAMMGIFGLMVHEAINGKPYVINELLGWGQPY